MNYNEGHFVRPRQPTLPPISNRTLHHPSFLPLYMAADFAHHHTDCNHQTVLPIIPAEFFYSDPTMSCGRRIPNIVSELMVFDYFQLNTPPPVMSACPAPPACPDPFRSEPHPTRDLGSLTFKTNPLHPPVQPSRVVLQLTQEEDQTITNLLKLHHQEPVQSDETLIAPQMDLNPISFLSPATMDSSSTEEAYKPFCKDVQHQREASLQNQLQHVRCWSDRELDAANTLLSRFKLMEKEQSLVQNHNKSAAALSGPLPYQLQRSETYPASVTADDTKKDIGFSFSQVRESGEPDWEDYAFEEGGNVDDVHLPVPEEYLTSSLTLRVPSLSPNSKAKSRSSFCGDFSEVKERTLSNSEGDAVFVLLSLGDMEVLDIVK